MDASPSENRYKHFMHSSHTKNVGPKCTYTASSSRIKGGHSCEGHPGKHKLPLTTHYLYSSVAPTNGTGKTDKVGSEFR